MSLSDIFQGLDAVTNLAVASILSWWALWRLEQRRRDKLLGAYFSELVALAHVIDLHQLFKDPKGTEVKLSQQELYYYFDYCCDLLAILSKIGVIYGQEYREEAATKHVADLQELCSDLSRRIGQKIELLTITPEIQ